jgi:hypothetical protein
LPGRGNKVSRTQVVRENNKHLVKLGVQKGKAKRKPRVLSS